MNRLQLRALDDKLAKERAYWLEKLSGEFAASGIPLDFKRPKSFAERTAVLSFEFQKPIADTLLRVCSGSDVLAFTVLLAALKICLSKYTGMENIIVGTTIHERFKEIATINRVIVLRDRVRRSATLRQVLLDVRSTLAQAYANQKYPLERILVLLGVENPPNRAPLFDVAITLQSISNSDYLKSLKHDVSMSFAITDNAIKGRVEYCPELFSTETIKAFMSHYEEVLQAVLCHPDKQVSEISLSLPEVKDASELTERSKSACENEYSAALTPMRRIERSKGMALSYAQQRLWFLHQLRPSSPAYNVASAVRLTGCLEVTMLELAVNQIVKRHEVLRTTFSMEGGRPVQKIKEFAPIKVAIEELTSESGEDREAEARGRIKVEAQRPFDLGRGPVLRAKVLKLSEREHVLVMVMHHIVFDSWSREVLVKELAEFYERNVRGEREEVEELEIQYADYAEWEREWIEGEEVEEQMRYWRKQLSGEIEELELGREGTEGVNSEEGGRERFEIGEELSGKIREMSRGEGVTEYMVMLAGFEALLYRYSGVREVVVGMPVANRRRRELEGMIGFFANTVVLRVELRGDPSFREMLRRVREVVVGAYENQEVPFEKVVEEMRPRGAFSNSPFVPILVDFEDELIAPIKCADLTISLVDADVDSMIHELTLHVVNRKERLAGTIKYNSALFDRASIVRMVDHFKIILREAVTYPDTRLIDIPLLDGDASAKFGIPQSNYMEDDSEQFDFSLWQTGGTS